MRAHSPKYRHILWMDDDGELLKLKFHEFRAIMVIHHRGF